MALSFPVPSAEKQPQSMILPLPCLTVFLLYLCCRHSESKCLNFHHYLSTEVAPDHLFVVQTFTPDGSAEVNLKLLSVINALCKTYNHATDATARHDFDRKAKRLGDNSEMLLKSLHVNDTWTDVQRLCKETNCTFSYKTKHYHVEDFSNLYLEVCKYIRVGVPNCPMKPKPPPTSTQSPNLNPPNMSSTANFTQTDQTSKLDKDRQSSEYNVQTLFCILALSLLANVILSVVVFYQCHKNQLSQRTSWRQEPIVLPRVGEHEDSEMDSLHTVKEETDLTPFHCETFLFVIRGNIPLVKQNDTMSLSLVLQLFNQFFRLFSSCFFLPPASSFRMNIDVNDTPPSLSC